MPSGSDTDLERLPALLAPFGDDALSPVETHGFLCAMAIDPSPPADWTSGVLPTGGTATPELSEWLERQRVRIAARLGLGDPVRLPCRLDPYEENEGSDLTAWCTGFMAGVTLNEAGWHQGNEETMARLLLPFLLISGLDEDPELDALWDDEKLVRQMARGLPELVEELFLARQAPELADTSGETGEPDA